MYIYIYIYRYRHTGSNCIRQSDCIPTSHGPWSLCSHEFPWYHRFLSPWGGSTTAFCENPGGQFGLQWPGFFRRFWNGCQSQHDVEKLMELMYLYLFQETFDIIWPGIYSFCQGEVENLLFTLFCRRRRYTEPSCRLDFCPDPAVMPGYVWNTSGPRPSGGHMAPSLALNDAVVDGLLVALNSEMEQHLEQLIRNENTILYIISRIHSLQIWSWFFCIQHLLIWKNVLFFLNFQWPAVSAQSSSMDWSTLDRCSPRKLLPLGCGWCEI